VADIRIAIIGFGKIARDEHVPAITQNPAFRLVAAVAPRGAPEAGVPVFADLHQMLQEIALDAAAICTPPAARHAIARDCLEAGLHVLLEKPPCTTLGEVADLAALSQQRRLSLFTSWHAQLNESVGEAARLIREQGLQSMRIDWLEDVEKWHPGQRWIWEPGGFGVFDAGINALSIATLLSPSVLVLRQARMVLHPAGQQPIAATLEIVSRGVAGPIEARFDWRHKGQERWTIEVLTRAGNRLLLSDGGAVLQVGDAAPIRHPGGEYAAIYARFEQLIRTQQSHIDTEPLRLTADAYLLADRNGAN